MKISLTHLSQLLPPDPRSRRETLIQEMSALEHRGQHCFSCSGVCCTFVANSMQTTPLEAAEILVWLASEDRLHEDLVAQLKETVRRFRLDQELPGDGRRPFRRTYTCTFFEGSAKGCSLSRAIKPYGCLGFNPRSSGLTEGGDCASGIDQLEQREQSFEAEEVPLNQTLRQTLALDWDKLPLPQALLALLDRVSLSQPEP